MKRGTIGGMPSRVKLPEIQRIYDQGNLGMAAACVMAAMADQMRGAMRPEEIWRDALRRVARRRWPGISAQEGMENAARNIQRLILKPPY